MSTENSVRTDETDSKPRVAGVATIPASRRTVLRTATSALAGGSFLIGAANEGAATSDDDAELDVRTTDVDVLDDGEDGEIRATGRISGMSNYDCERCEIGAHVRPMGGDAWHGGLRTVEHTHRDSFRVGVTLAGLHPGEYECRLCACPIIRDDLFVANVLLVIVERDESSGKPDHHGESSGKTDHHGESSGKTDHHDGKRKDRDALEAAYRTRCPCDLHHPDQCHLLIRGGSPSNVCDYAFRVPGGDVRRVGVSSAPDVISSRHVTVDTEEVVGSSVVTGAVAGGGDSYLCRGRLAEVRFDRGASVYVNGYDVTDAVSDH